MLLLQRTNSDNTDFHELVVLLDLELRERDGEEHVFYAQFNKIENIKQVVLVYQNNKAIACGAIKAYDANSMEIKRMFVLPEYRGHKIAAMVLNELEKWTAEMGYHRCLLETGIKQPEAIRLYQRENYRLISNYEPYTNVADSRCFEKMLTAKTSDLDNC